MQISVDCCQNFAKAVIEHNTKSGFWACGLYCLDANQICGGVANGDTVDKLCDKDTASANASEKDT